MHHQQINPPFAVQYLFHLYSSIDHVTASGNHRPNRNTWLSSIVPLQKPAVPESLAESCERRDIWETELWRKDREGVQPLYHTLIHVFKGYHCIQGVSWRVGGIILTFFLPFFFLCIYSNTHACMCTCTAIQSMFQINCTWGPMLFLCN